MHVFHFQSEVRTRMMTFKDSRPVKADAINGRLHLVTGCDRLLNMCAAREAELQSRDKMLQASQAEAVLLRLLNSTKSYTESYRHALHIGRVHHPRAGRIKLIPKRTA